MFKNFYKSEKQQKFEEIQVASLNDKLTDRECEEKARKIKLLSANSGNEALENLLRLLQYDSRGEISIHASLALASRSDKKSALMGISNVYNSAPATCEAGYPPKAGMDVFPRTRLLYPLAWMKETDLMTSLLDNSGNWPGANKGKLLAYAFVDDVSKGIYAIVDRLVYLEYLDETGTKELMNLTLEFYPNLSLKPDVWKNVKR